MLTNDQIEQLFRFCRQKYIHFYDVQMELVDHFAENIEAQWKKDPTIRFEVALNNAYKEFGGYKEMQAVQEQKRKQTSKHYRKLRWSFFWKQFRFPKLLVTGTVGLAFYSALTLLPAIVVCILLPLVFLMSIAWEIRVLNPVHKQMRLKKGHLLMFENGSMFSGMGLTYIVVRFMVSFYEEWSKGTSARVIVAIAFFSVLATIYFASIKSYGEYLLRLQLDAYRQYPHLFDRSPQGSNSELVS